MSPKEGLDYCLSRNFEWNDPWRRYDFDSGEGECFFSPGQDKSFDREKGLVAIVINYEERYGFDCKKPTRAPGQL
ncbi:putative P7 protein [Cytorhabdovirus fragariae]|uniref:Putative P7 protein n=1 Tax=Cytorhabdovirus fragariae TaxID=2676436 RepID=A0A650AD29_9RHAB|nr:putative P7 protein [Cytorhabdovirus fragariae]QGN65762.1 putative P7 protein [Cytorhabdovirus fragariae]